MRYFGIKLIVGLLLTPLFILGQGRIEPPKPKPQPKVVAVSKPDGDLNGHGYVDLGLPSGTKWATTNIGASSPSDNGSYFAWGETSPKSNFTQENSRTNGREMNDIGGSYSFDAARGGTWGSDWRVPSKEQFQELINLCQWTWTTIGGHKGYKVMGPNGKTIFLPANGEGGSGNDMRNMYGYYWAANPLRASDGNERDDELAPGNKYAWGMNFTKDFMQVNNCYMRFNGMGIRPVFNKSN